MVLQLFTHKIYRIVSALSIATLLHTKNTVFADGDYLGTDRQTDTETDTQTDTQEDYCYPPPTRSG